MLGAGRWAAYEFAFVGVERDVDLTSRPARAARPGATRRGVRAPDRSAEDPALDGNLSLIHI